MKIQDFQVKEVEFSLLNCDTIHEKKFHEKLKKSTGVISDFVAQFIMVTRYNVRQQLAWQPKPAKKSEVEIPYEEGKILPNSPEEEIELPMLRAAYSEKQLRSMKRRKNKEKFSNKKQQRRLMRENQYEDVIL